MQSHHPPLEVQKSGDVAIVSFTQRSLLSPDLIEAIGQQLFSLVEKDNCRKFILHFGNVESMTTAMVGKLVGLHKRVEAAGGRLALCRIGPFLSEIFKILNVPTVMPVYSDEQKALDSFREF